MKRNLSQGALATRQQRSNASKYIIIAMFLIFGLVSREFTVRLLSNENDRSMISASSAEALSKSISEYDSETGFTQSILVKSNSPIFSMQSKFQFIQVHESEHWGKILVLDGVTQLTGTCSADVLPMLTREAESSEWCVNHNHSWIWAKNWLIVVPLFLVDLDSHASFFYRTWRRFLQWNDGSCTALSALESEESFGVSRTFLYRARMHERLFWPSCLIAVCCLTGELYY